MNGDCLLDTNIIIGLFAADPAIVQNLRQAPRVFIPSIVIGELYYGALRSTRAQDNLARIEQLAARNIVLDCDVETARHYGYLKDRLRRQGCPLPENDLWIAALARQYQLTLITRDAHFSHIPDVQQLSW
ncbi:MAG TPA: type II toxin-antitoxin system VapC family toxin [Anaerolineae bacterium]|nr:type II toxin-antitoxin system VapC family toxin [Anaerolineae bacterium]